MHKYCKQIFQDELKFRNIIGHYYIITIDKIGDNVKNKKARNIRVTINETTEVDGQYKAHDFELLKLLV